MLTAAKSDKGRLMDYIHKLNEFGVDEIAALCISQGLYEEALEIHKKVNNHQAAADVLVDHIVSIDRAQEYAEGVDLPEVWSKVAKAQLDGLRVTDSIESYIKAQDPSNYNEVIETASHAGKDEDLVKYLKMARKTQREPAIDTALAFSYARLDQLPELEDFLRGCQPLLMSKPVVIRHTKRATTKLPKSSSLAYRIGPSLQPHSCTSKNTRQLSIAPDAPTVPRSGSKSMKPAWPRRSSDLLRSVVSTSSFMPKSFKTL